MNIHRIQYRQALEAILLISCTWTMTLHAQQSGTGLVFYTQRQVSEDLLPALFEVLHADLDEETELPKGVLAQKDATFMPGSDNFQIVPFSRVISVKLLGRCDVLPQTNRPLQQGPLGWVLLVGGTIQPFVSIDCARLAQVLRPAVAGLNEQERRYAMLQAIAHVLIHEWNHIATQSSAHGARGLTRPELSVNELIAAPRSRHLSAAIR